jgi:hypothetical protein
MADEMADEMVMEEYHIIVKRENYLGKATNRLT